MRNLIALTKRLFVMLECFYLDTKFRLLHSEQEVVKYGIGLIRIYVHRFNGAVHADVWVNFRRNGIPSLYGPYELYDLSDDELSRLIKANENIDLYVECQDIIRTIENEELEWIGEK